jgi:hypothetical protein
MQKDTKTRRKESTVNVMKVCQYVTLKKIIVGGGGRI